MKFGSIQEMKAEIEKLNKVIQDLEDKLLSAKMFMEAHRLPKELIEGIFNE